jgi:hypothetical protein
MMIESWLMELSQMWLTKLALLWLTFNIFIIATSWYSVTVIKRRFPVWWKQNIADMAPPQTDYLDAVDAAHIHGRYFSVKPSSHVAKTSH